MPKSNELKRSRPVVMLKVNIFVTSSMMEAIFATLHKKNTIVIKIKKWQIVLIEGLFTVTIQGIDHQQLLKFLNSCQEAVRYLSYEGSVSNV